MIDCKNIWLKRDDKGAQVEEAQNTYRRMITTSAYLLMIIRSEDGRGQS